MGESVNFFSFLFLFLSFFFFFFISPLIFSLVLVMILGCAGFRLAAGLECIKEETRSCEHVQSLSLIGNGDTCPRLPPLLPFRQKRNQGKFIHRRYYIDCYSFYPFLGTGDGRLGNVGVGGGLRGLLLLVELIIDRWRSSTAFISFIDCRYL